MLVFSSEVINNALASEQIPYNPNTTSRLPSHHGGEIGGSLEDLIVSLLDLGSRDAFGDIGCGRAKFLMRMKLRYQSNECFGIESDSRRLHHGIYWWIRVYIKLLQVVPNASPYVGTRRNPSSPKIINGDFTCDSFWRRYGEFLFSSRKLKLFFNNFGGHMLHDGVQDLLEMKLNDYCQSGTVVVSLSEMFLDCKSRARWSLDSVVNHPIIPGDVSWSEGGNGDEIKVFLYVKY